MNTPVKKKHTTGKIPADKKWYEMYEDIYAYSITPISEKFLDRLFQELIEWAEDDSKEALKITEFFLRRRISSDSVARFRARDKKYDQAYKHAMAIIGNRREIGSLKKKYDSTIVGITMPRYDKDWVELVEWKASLQKGADAQATGNITVVLEPYNKHIEVKQNDNKN